MSIESTGFVYGGVYERSLRILDFPLDRKDGGKNRFGGRKSGVPEAKGRKCFKRAGVAVRLSNTELIGILGKSSFGGTMVSLTA